MNASREVKPIIGDYRRRAAPMQEERQMINVAAFVADHLLARGGRSERGGCAPDIGGVASGQQEGMRAAFFVDERVDFFSLVNALINLLQPPGRA